MDALKPCPMCGHEAPAQHLHEGGQYRVYCPSCRLSTGWRASQAEAITAWNTRVPPPSAPVEAVAWRYRLFYPNSASGAIWGPWRVEVDRPIIHASVQCEIEPLHPTPPAVERLVEAAKEGLICAEADLEDQRDRLRDYGEDPEEDSLFKVFKARRDKIAEALATFQEVGR